MFEYISATQPTVGMQNSNIFPLINTPKYQFIIYFLHRFDELCVLINAQMHVHSMLVKVNAEIQTIIYKSLCVFDFSFLYSHTVITHICWEIQKKNAIEFPCWVPISVFTVQSYVNNYFAKNEKVTRTKIENGYFVVCTR